MRSTTTEVVRTEEQVEIKELSKEDRLARIRALPHDTNIPQVDENETVPVEFEYKEKLQEVEIRSSTLGRAMELARGGKVSEYEDTVIGADGKEKTVIITVRDTHSGMARLVKLFKLYVVTVNGNSWSQAAAPVERFPPAWAAAFGEAFAETAGLDIPSTFTEAREKSDAP